MPVTICLIIANLVVFGFYIDQSSLDSLSDPDTLVLYKMGASFGAAVFVEHQYWRLLTSMFLHSNLAHIAMNMFSLFIFGRLLEKPLGSSRFFCLYFISGAFGALTSIGWRPWVEGVGASGAIVGLFGFYMILQLLTDEKGQSSWTYRLRQIITLGLVLYISNLAPGIDYACHFGGMVGGIACGVAFARFSDLRVRWCWKDFAIVSFFSALALLTFWIESGTIGQDKSLPALILVKEAMPLIDKPDLPAAAAKLDQAVRLAPDNVNILLLHASVIAEMRRIPEALADCDKVLSIDPKNTRAQYIRRALEDFVKRHNAQQ
ncbi:MAG: rhomboid family intramembrane serine protease [Cyanobacteria bacterium REEB67]|nr:rhomboid family intramembrane serine protease [Cyanobacteria bacterium REEB67]